MPKNEPAQALLKRLQKIEQAHGKLAEMSARIRATADTVADLVKLAQTFIEESTAHPAPAPSGTRKAAAKRAPAKRVPAKRAPRKAATGRPPGRPKAATKRASAPASTPARARKPATRGRSVATRTGRPPRSAA